MQDTMSILLEEIDTVFARFAKHKHVAGMLVFDMYGTPLRTTFSPSDTLAYLQMATDLVMKTQRGMKDLGIKDEPLEIIRLRIGSREVPKSVNLDSLLPKLIPNRIQRPLNYHY